MHQLLEVVSQRILNHPFNKEKGVHCFSLGVIYLFVKQPNIELPTGLLPDIYFLEFMGFCVCLFFNQEYERCLPLPSQCPTSTTGWQH